MKDEARGTGLPGAVESALRELVNALGKSTMYPPAHRFVAESTAALVDRLGQAMELRDSLVIGILPHGLVVDGKAAEPLPAMLRDFAVRMHRKNIGAIQLRRGLDVDEASALLRAIAASDADETVGQDGFHLAHVRVEPMTYDTLTLEGAAAAGSATAGELDEAFWVALTEAVLDRQLNDGESSLSTGQLADLLSGRVEQDPEAARRVYAALSDLASALVARRGRDTGGARQRFIELLSALSKSTTTHIVAAAPSTAARRRFVVETLELVPPTLLIQVLESVAEVDGEAISDHLLALLGKLSRAEGDSDVGFPIQVLGLLQQWDEIGDTDDEATDPHAGIDPARVLTIGLELATASDSVIAAARSLVREGRLGDAIALVDHPENDPPTVRAIGDAVLDLSSLELALSESAPDSVVIERIATHVGAPSVGPLLDALGAASERTTRRRLLELLTRVGAGAGAVFVARLDGAPWYLARNILILLAQLPTVENVEPVFRLLEGPDARVRQEALKVLVRQPAARDRAIAYALASGEDTLVRTALVALGADSCPRPLVVAVLAVLDRPDADLQLLAVRALAGSDSPLIVPRLLPIVRARRGLFRRRQLQAKSPAMLAALELLARRWRRAAPVAGVLQLAARSSDADVLAAIGGSP